MTGTRPSASGGIKAAGGRVERDQWRLQVKPGAAADLTVIGGCVTHPVQGERHTIQGGDDDIDVLSILGQAAHAHGAGEVSERGAGRGRLERIFCAGVEDQVVDLFGQGGGREIDADTADAAGNAVDAQKFGYRRVDGVGHFADQVGTRVIVVGWVRQNPPLSWRMNLERLSYQRFL